MKYPENKIPIKATLKVSKEVFKRMFPLRKGNKISVAIKVIYVGDIQLLLCSPNDVAARVIPENNLFYLGDWQSWHDEISPVDLLDACGVGAKKKIDELQIAAKNFNDSGLCSIKILATFINKDERENQLKIKFKKTKKQPE
jgi:hypothetical protein